MEKTEKDCMSQSDFERLGGRGILLAYSKNFYDKVYAHPWISKYFEGIDQTTIELQQVDFLQGALGGEKMYCGKMPIAAHLHMNISEELFKLRHQLVLEALHEVKASEELIEKIIKIDASFKKGIVKASRADCVKRFPTQEILDFPNPHPRAIKKAA